MQSLANGTQLGAYTIVRLVGRGGMGEVYEAYEERLQRRVALKVIAPQKAGGSHGEADLLRRFLQEARTLAQVNHPNVVTIYAIDHIGDTQFIAMEFVEGALLKDIFSAYALSGDEAAPIFIQMLEGLRSLHDNRILHRDLKPHNLILRPDGQIKILDFGIAKRLGDKSHDHTTVGVVVGTLAYLPPEVLQGIPATIRSDLWSLGAIFYEALVGQQLVGPTAEKVNGVRAFAGSEIIFPAECLDWVPEDMRAIIGKLCDLRPDSRYENAAAVIDDLRLYQQARPPMPASTLRALWKATESISQARRSVTKDTLSRPTGKRALLVSSMRLPEPINVPLVVEELPKPPTSRSDRQYTQVVKDSVSSRQRSKRRSKEEEGLGWQIPAALVAVGMLLYFAIHALVSGRSQSVATRVEEPPAVVEGASVAPLALTVPALHQALWLEPTQIPTLAWSAAVAPGEYELQISADADFHNLILAEPVSSNLYRPSRALAEGAYSWRLWPVSGQGQAIGPSYFSISYLSAPELLWPSSKQTYELTRLSKFYDMGFGWRCKPGAQKYRAQVGGDSAFENVVKDQVVSGCSWNQVSLPAGEYFWRVRVDQPAMARAVWSASRPFTVKATQTSAPLPSAVSVPTAVERPRAQEKKVTKAAGYFEKVEPRLKNPQQKVTLQFKDGNASRDVASARKQLKSPPAFSWQPVREARSYRLQIAWTPDFSKLLSEETVMTNYYTWKQVIPGRMYWRVRAVNEAGLLTAYSGQGQIDVRVPAPSLNSSYAFNERNLLEWAPVPLAEKYIVQVGSQRSLAGATDKLINQAQIPLDLKSSTEPVFVRVAAASSSGERVSNFSRVASVTLEGTPAKSVPKLLTPRKGVRVKLGVSGRISVIFSWAKIEGAKGYTLEVAWDPEFTKLIEQRTVKGNHAVLKEAELWGPIYWRVRTEDSRSPAQEPSEWSATGSFEVQ